MSAPSLGLKEMYLILYNSLCCGGWAGVAMGGFKVLMDGGGLDTVYDPVASKLSLVQMAALLEIVHAATGLVRSPVMVTAMQVMSRIFALVAIVYSPHAQGKIFENF